MTDKEKEIVQALRCTSTPGGPTGDCEKCPYWKIEQLTAEQKEKLGVDTWTSCDIDKVGTDAADLIERLKDLQRKIDRPMKGYYKGKPRGVFELEQRFRAELEQEARHE